jgi:hypothetical protein
LRREVGAHFGRWTAIPRRIATKNPALRQQSIVLHLTQTLRAYFDYFHYSRTHLWLERNAPEPRRVELPSQGRVIAIPQVGGLHHRDRRAA